MKSMQDTGPGAFDEVHLTSAKVKARYGISDMSLHRWLNDESVGFPKPLGIGKRRYWRLSDLQAFEIRSVGKKNVTASHISHQRRAAKAAKAAVQS
jgi:predicted DNA-binding transcriptional regulator AlpA